MSIFTELDSDFITEAEAVAAAEDRSASEQIAYWAQLGKAVEPLFRNRTDAPPQPLSHLISTVGTEEGEARLTQVLASRPFPHYETVADRPGYLIRTTADGDRCIGKFVGREFVVEDNCGV